MMKPKKWEEKKRKKKNKEIYTEVVGNIYDTPEFM